MLPMALHRPQAKRRAPPPLTPPGALPARLVRLDIDERAHLPGVFMERLAGAGIFGPHGL